MESLRHTRYANPVNASESHLNPYHSSSSPTREFVMCLKIKVEFLSLTKEGQSFLDDDT
jgi:hypothetical protein